MNMLRAQSPAILLVTLLPLLGGCAVHPTSSVRPEQARLVGVSTAQGSVLMFDTLPVPQIVGDTVYARRDGVPYAIPKGSVAALWMARPGERAVSVPMADSGRLGKEPPTPRLQVGQLVRVTAPSARMDRSLLILEAVSADTLVLAHVWGPGDTTRSRVPFDAVRKAEVSNGIRSAALPGLVIGAAVGTVVGATIGARNGANSWTPCQGFCLFYPSKDDLEVRGALRGGAVGSLIGGACGLIVGGALSSERWVQVPLDGVRPTLAPLPGGRVGLGVSLAF